MGMMASCCVQSTVGSLGDALGSEVNDAKDSTSARATKHLDKLAGDEEKNDDPVEGAFNKVIDLGNNLVFNGKATIDKQKRDKLRTKNKVQLDSIRKKYQPEPQASRKNTPQANSDRQKYEEIKARLAAGSP